MRVKFRGFTLLEVLIALAILTVSALAVLSQAGQSLTQIQQLQLRSTAMVVAENQLTLLHIQPDWPGLGTRSNTVMASDSQWNVQTSVSATSDPWLRKIEVNVHYGDQYNSNSSSAVLAHLVSYRGRY